VASSASREESKEMHVFGPNDFLREKIKAKRNKEEVKREDHTRKQEAS
jgi:hypothetical protein